MNDALLCILRLTCTRDPQFLNQRTSTKTDTHIISYLLYHIQSRSKHKKVGHGHCFLGEDSTGSKTTTQLNQPLKALSELQDVCRSPKSFQLLFSPWLGLFCSHMSLKMSQTFPNYNHEVTGPMINHDQLKFPKMYRYLFQIFPDCDTWYTW